MSSTNAQPSTLWTIYKPRVFSKRTKCRFVNERTGELISHLGRSPTFPEKLLVNRIISLEWWLCQLDSRIDAGGELSGHAIRGRLAAEQRLRLDLQALGIGPREPPQPQQPAAKPAAQPKKTRAKATAEATYDDELGAALSAADDIRLLELSDARLAEDDRRRLTAELARRGLA